MAVNIDAAADINLAAAAAVTIEAVADINLTAAAAVSIEAPIINTIGLLLNNEQPVVVI